MSIETILSERINTAVEEFCLKTLGNAVDLRDDDVVNDLNRNIYCGIRFKGKLEGIAEITISEFDAAGVASLMLGDDLDENTLDTKDVVGEMLNIIIGGTKNKLEHTGYTYTIGLPEFFHGVFPDFKVELKTISQNFICDGLKFKIVVKFTEVIEVATPVPPQRKPTAAELLMAAMKKKS